MREQQSFLETAIINPIRDNVTLVMLFAGLACLVVGGLAGSAIDSWTYVPDGTGKVLLNTGTSILGAGIFSVIMKSGQFTKLFQEHIFDVFHSPEKLKRPEELNNRWEIITQAILQKVLPKTYGTASKEIKELFFTEETHFHFEDLQLSYQIDVSEDKKTVTIINKLRTWLVVSPSQTDPVLIQTVSTGGNCELLSLFVGGHAIDIATHPLIPDKSVANTHHLKVDLKPHFNPATPDGRRIMFQRTLKVRQNINDEPYIFGKFTRYILGACISAKISAGYELHFCNSGMNPNIPGEEDGDGYKCWLLAEDKKLLLPGQAYTIVIAAKSS